MDGGYHVEPKVSLQVGTQLNWHTTGGFLHIKAGIICILNCGCNRGPCILAQTIHDRDAMGDTYILCELYTAEGAAGVYNRPRQGIVSRGTQMPGFFIHRQQRCNALWRK